MDTRRPVERRTRTMIGLRCAHAHLRGGDAEQAAATVLGFRQDLTGIASARVRGELRQLRRGWQPYRAAPRVAEAGALAAGLLR
ncbi:hypothetical protein [Streptosporangium sp. NPDC087985]|uniref:hypothetical protein n=1 Tax=Streptosporangium sp. NPDC087985 TaxID=3366196 RepID=UPI00381E3CB6